MSTTGHAKNVANFETVTIILSALGADYNPSQPLIQLPALQARLTAAKNALAAVDTADAAKTVAVNERAAEFKDLGNLAVNVRRTAEVEVNDEAFTADLQTIIRRFRGERSGDAPVDDPATPDVNEALNTHSVSQRGYDDLVTHFADLVALVKTQPAYNPNDAEMKVTALETKLAALQSKNNAAKAAEAAHGNALDARDEILYHPDTGIIKLVKLIKTQLARKPGKSSAAYQQVTALEFRKY
ncbi:MAG: hypothetical protein M3384_05105 [Acidobacteriota bacterium]|nr:hypothetical protein [Acidobacteriota bacterium]